jgi:hypothetical protein
MRTGKSSFAAIVCVSLAAWACGRGEGGETRLPEGAEPWVHAPADTQWVTIEGVEFPSPMDRTDPEVLEAYLFAAKHPEVLSYMPCYCGCEDPRSAHKSNYDCFIDIIDRTGALPRVSPDPMGFA